MEGNVRRRRRDSAAGMPAQEPQIPTQPQVEQDLSVREQCLMPAYQRRQAANAQMGQAVPVVEPVQPVSRTAMEQNAYQRPMAQPVQTSARSMPIAAAEMEQTAVRRRRTPVSPVQLDDEPIQPQRVSAAQSALPEETPVQQAAPVRAIPANTAAIQKETPPKAEKKHAAPKRTVKKKEKPAHAAPAEPVNYGELIRLPRKKWVAFFLCLLGGMFGLHKFYERKIGKGILYMLTVGLAGFGILIDLIALLRKPTVYYVEVKRRKPLIQALKDFRFDIIGYIISGVGAVIVSLTIMAPEIRGAVMSPVVGAGVMLAGAALTLLNTRNLVKTLIINAVILAGMFAFFFLWALVVAIVVIQVVGMIFNINILGAIFQLFSKDDTGEVGAIHSVQGMPTMILGDDGQRYRCAKRSAHAAVYVGERNSNEVIIRDNDIDPHGRSAVTMGYIFKW